MAPHRPPGSSRRSECSPAGGTSSAFIGTPKCPKELDKVERKKWKELVKLLTAMELITKADRDGMALYCVQYGHWLEAEAMVKKFGGILKNKEGALYRSPYLDMSNHASKELQRLSRMLGLDALSRKKLGFQHSGKIEENANLSEAEKSGILMAMAAKLSAIEEAKEGENEDTEEMAGTPEDGPAVGPAGVPANPHG
jgi:P27 family predicted phage terminase small subunit